MLNEMRNDLIKDTIYFNLVKGRPQRVQAAANQLLQHFGAHDIPADTINKLADDLKWNFRYIYHKGAYSVRLTMTDLYDFYLPRTNLLIAGIRSSREQREMDMEDKLFGYEKVINEEGEYDVRTVPLSTNLMTDPLFLKYIESRKSAVDNDISRLESITSLCEQLLQLLDKELESKTRVKTYRKPFGKGISLRCGSLSQY